MFARRATMFEMVPLGEMVGVLVGLGLLFSIFVVLPAWFCRLESTSGADGAWRFWFAGAIVRTQTEEGGEGPYREATVRHEQVLREIPQGMPWTLCLLAGPMGAHSLLWTIAIALSLKDLLRAMFRLHADFQALFSLFFCTARAGFGWTALVCVVARRTTLAFPALLMALSLDVLLSAYTLPLSASRAEDLSMARAGAVLVVPLLALFSIASMRRMGMRENSPKTELMSLRSGWF